MRGHVLTGDELVENGGKDQGPTPTELVLSGLATCTAATMKMYADRKEWPLDRINIDIGIRTARHEDGTQTAHIERVIRIEGPLSDQQKDRLLQIAEKCPVHRLLTQEVRIATRQAESQ
jgi:putative redox protein